LKKLKHIKKILKETLEGEESASPLPDPSSTSTKYWADRGKVSLEFLQKEGSCQDHIRPDISTVPHAGRGGFASRDLPKGTIVGYSPLVPIALRGEQITQVTYNGESKHGLDRFEFRGMDASEDKHYEEYVEEAMEHDNRYTKPDLVINYTFGHRKSTLLLTPYGGMVNYINHKSAKDGDGPNVKVEWPKREMIAHKPDWISKPFDEILHTTDKIGLSFNYVALRDIKEGEEIFLDYGDEWDAAWKEHVANWVPPEDAEGYVHSTKFETKYLRTLEELAEEEYPWNLHTLCTEMYAKRDGINTYVESYTKEEDEGTLTELLPCVIVGRVEEGDEYKYTVEIHEAEDQVVTVTGYPRNEHGVELYDKAYSPMWHMKEAFRHKLFVPDDVFPENWMNLE